MALEQEAAVYAIKTVNSTQQAYIDGYNAAKMKYDRTPVEEDGIKYFDFGLPSGTLWSMCIASDITYEEALDWNIPTEEDLNELKAYTHSAGHLIMARNGEFFKIDEYSRYWLKGNIDHKGFAKFYRSDLSIDRTFMGRKIKIMVVKKK